MSNAHKKNLRYTMADRPQADFVTQNALAQMIRTYKVSDTLPTITPKRELDNACGGEFETGAEDLARDAELAFSADAFPRFTGQMLYYLMGGGAGYSVAAASGLYKSAFKRLLAPQTQQDALGLIRWFEGDTATYHRFQGGIVGNVKISGQKNARLKVEGKIMFDGALPVAVSSFDPTAAPCVPEKPYRFNGGVFTFGPFGGSAITGLVPQSFSWMWDDDPEDDPDRTGLVAIGREYGDRKGEVMFEVIGKPGDAVDLAFQNNTTMAWSGLFTTSTGEQLWLYAPKCVITKLDPGFTSGKAPKQTHKLTLKPILDVTSATAIAKSPVWAEITTDIPTYVATT